jgi:7-alpha-hydroxysteroid dehydrogenase
MNAISQDFSLAGKVALVTGSGRGIGEGIAKKLAEAGAAIAVTGRTQSEIESVANEIKASGGRAHPIVIDFNQVDKLPAVVDEIVATFGGLDIIVNNAGGSRSPAFMDTRIEDLNKEFHLIVAAPFELCRLAVPHMLKRPGASIINIIGPGAFIYPRGNLAYYTSKAALTAMTKLMAADLGPKIRVNGVVPGAVETPALAKFFEMENPQYRQMVENAHRLKRMSKPEEVGNAVLYLASPAAAFATASILYVNGGHIDESRVSLPDL